MPGKQSAIVVIHALICVLALSPLLEASKHGRHVDKKKQTRIIRPEDVPIDAFNMDICGKMSASAVRPWHKQQSAFGCARGRNQEGRDIGRSRVVAGEQESGSEFPFSVTLVLGTFVCPEDWPRLCSGILVHKDLVITAASCLRPIRSVCDVDYIELRFPGARGREEAKRWCWHSPKRSPFPEHELAVIKLEKPLDSYTPGKNAPACLPRSNAEPAQNATCAIVGRGMTNVKFPVKHRSDDIPKTFEHLQTTTVKRNDCGGSNSVPYESCYRSKRGLGCDMDLGGPVVCYDRCSKAEPDSVQAFAVGVMSRRNNCSLSEDKINRRDATTTHAIDLHSYRSQLMELLEVMYKNKTGSDTVICLDHWKVRYSRPKVKSIQ